MQLYILSADEEPPVDPDNERLQAAREDSGPPFFSEPTGIFVDPGDTVRFTLATPDHTVTANRSGPSAG